MSDPGPAAALDPDQSHFIFVTGRKGSGKSVLAQRLWDSYPYDRLVIDPTGDIDAGPDTENIRAPLPPSWPIRHDKGRSSLRFVPNRLDPAYRDDIDRAVGLAFFHHRTLLWADEIHELTRANSTPPHFDMALHQGRHRKMTLVMCGPRPMDINPLCISQADYVYVFALPNPKDRQRVAEVIGFAPKEFDRLVQGLAQYHYLRWDAREQILDFFPPLPVSRPRPAAK